jgi:hypothetical protein
LVVRKSRHPHAVKHLGPHKAPVAHCSALWKPTPIQHLGQMELPRSQSSLGLPSEAPT